MSRRGHKKALSNSTFGLAVEQWPEADKALWTRARRPGNVLDLGGRASKWAPRTVRNVETVYGHWLKWLGDGAKVSLENGPLERVTRERVKQYVEFLQAKVAPFTVQLHLQRLGQMMVAFTETKEFCWLFRAANRLKPKSVRNKRAKMQPSYAIADLGMRLIQQSESMEENWHAPPAIVFRDGLIIALLAYCPMRVGNLASIRIGEHLRQIGDNFTLVFGADETKQREALSFEIPQSLSSFVQRYLAVHRPALLARRIATEHAGDRLWVARDGGPLTGTGILALANKRTKAAFGSPINPHLFRDCAATTIATDDPGHAYAIPGVLGHSSMVTSEKHYNQARMMDAAQKFHAVLQSHRRRRRSAKAA